MNVCGNSAGGRDRKKRSSSGHLATPDEVKAKMRGINNTALKQAMCRGKDRRRVTVVFKRARVHYAELTLACGVLVKMPARPLPPFGFVVAIWNSMELLRFQVVINLSQHLSVSMSDGHNSIC